MNFTLLKKLSRSLAFILILATTTLACTENAEQQTETGTNTTSGDTIPVVDKRPAPKFFIVPENMVKTRVWICENQTADVFHLKHDCPVLIECKGKGTFRNVTLPKAIEVYGRYNCQVCAKELDYIFDEDAIRIETGFGQ